MKIVEAVTHEQLEHIRVLFREYEKWLGLDLSAQNFENELRDLPGKYSNPTGSLLLAVEDGEPVGCVALRPFEGDICEMKRLYVIPECKGKGIGRLLETRIIEEARKLGYKRMFLSTLGRLKEAYSLHKSLGFFETEPYLIDQHPYPGTIYMELEL
jgi:GNAT superfamily N-acetyltransferase